MSWHINDLQISNMLYQFLLCEQWGENIKLYKSFQQKIMRPFSWISLVVVVANMKFKTKVHITGLACSSVKILPNICEPASQPVLVVFPGCQVVPGGARWWWQPPPPWTRQVEGDETVDLGHCCSPLPGCDVSRTLPSPCLSQPHHPPLLCSSVLSNITTQLSALTTW